MTKKKLSPQTEYSESLEPMEELKNIISELQLKINDLTFDLSQTRDRLKEVENENIELKKMAELPQTIMDIYDQEVASPNKLKYTIDFSPEYKSMDKLEAQLNDGIFFSSPYELNNRMCSTMFEGMLLPKIEFSNKIDFSYDLYQFGNMYNHAYSKETSSIGLMYQLKSLNEKLLLLDKALELGYVNYNNIIIILLWLKETLSPDLFLRIVLIPRVLAQKIYIKYLERTFMWKEAENLHRVFNNMHDLVMCSFQKVLSYSRPGNINQKELEAIDELIQLSSSFDIIKFETNEFISLRHLFSIQSNLNNRNSMKLQNAPSNSIENIPPPSAEKVPLRDLIHNLLVFHPKSNAILKNKSFFGMSNKHFTYLQVLSACQREEYHLLPELLTVTGLISRKPNSPLNLYSFIKLGRDNNIPSEVMEHFLSFVTPDQLKLYLSKSLQLFDMAIVLCQKLKNKDELLSIKDIIKYSSINNDKKINLDRKIDDILVDPRNKWLQDGIITIDSLDLKVLFQ